MRGVTGILVLAGVAAAVGATAQQAEARWTIRMGYYTGNEFANGANTGKLDGFAFGVDAPLIRRISGVGALSFSLDFDFGGTTRSGGDTDGNLYNFLLTLRRELGRTPLYAGIGIGYSQSEARDGQFADKSGFAARYLLGYDFPVRSSEKYQPLLEIGFQDGVDNRLRGWSFQAGVRFR